jgi:hypothetical protein
MADVKPSAEPTLQADDATRTVLAVLRDRSMDGYTLMSKSGLDRPRLEQILRDLTARALVRATGYITADRLGESFFSVPQDMLGYVDQLLGRVRSVFYR